MENKDIREMNTTQRIGEFELNKIYCMDCLEGLKKIPDNSVDLVVTDPPYFFEAHSRGFAGEREKLFMGLKEIGVNKDKSFITKELLSELLRVCDEKNIFIFCNKAQIFDILLFVKEKNLSFDLIPLCKTAPMPLANNQWLPDREWGIHLFRNCEVKGSYQTKQGFFLDSNYQQDKFNHPSVKPESMIRRIINNLSDEGGLVLDCFMGSGTTAFACKSLKRNFIGFEINPEYVKIANKRLAQEILKL